MRKIIVMFASLLWILSIRVRVVSASTPHNLPLASPSISFAKNLYDYNTNNIGIDREGGGSHKTRTYRIKQHTNPFRRSLLLLHRHRYKNIHNMNLLAQVSSWKSTPPKSVSSILSSLPEISLPSSRARLYNLPNQRTAAFSNQSWSLTTIILAINVGMYALQLYNPDITNWGVKLSERILKGEELYRLLSPVFLHGSLIHLMMNSFSLQRVGVDTEMYFGKGRYLTTYLVSGITGNILSALKSPNPALGASGAIFGIMGAYWSFLMRHNFIFGSGAADAVSQTIFFNLVFGFLGSSGIDNWGHLGGFIGGIAMATTFGPNLRIEQQEDTLGKTVYSREYWIDEPLMRLPRYYESLPQQIGELSLTLIRLPFSLLQRGYNNDTDDNNDNNNNNNNNNKSRPWRTTNGNNSRTMRLKKALPIESLKPDSDLVEEMLKMDRERALKIKSATNTQSRRRQTQQYGYYGNYRKRSRR